MFTKQVKLHGGPKDGEVYPYGDPLPKVLVIAEVSERKGPVYHDYMQVGETEDYNWIGKTKAK
ncbi:hypothetical protein HWC80_gp091 [Mycobacterium phage Indlulamithi]|uniref:Uncharacterized protein n=1 Tax=Mycobacterium phage Indlulamithi TaxID=2656582 RepID=A0A649VCQ3_9CAUD|nr:hypothetical protein HWC80_gp091 [Mycobacterium phage Indlulamithi]QGJ90121.1 hypothetical protein PBI_INDLULAMITHI_83 [Mycobacterium phage Indlulamithi]